MKAQIIRIILFPAIIMLKTFDFLVSTFTDDKSVLDESEIPFADLLRSHRATFLAEYNVVLAAKKLHNVKDFYKVGTDLQHDDNWKGVPLVLFNHLFNENAAHCPQTVKLAKELPGCTAVMFLVAGPGKHIPPHRGIYKGFYRCLFTIQLPDDADCWIKVAGRKVFFKEGETIVFDETFEHEVLNASANPRVALSLDFYRKLPFPLNMMNAGIYFLLSHSFFVTNILDQYKRLENESYSYFKSQKAALR